MITAFRAGLAATLFAAACGQPAGERSEPVSPPAPGASFDASAGYAIDPAGDLNAFFDCLDREGRAIISAHRGGPATGLPENSLAAIEATLNALPAMIEIDVAASADGVLFLMHDDTLERTTTGRGVVRETPWARIRELSLIDEQGRASRFAPPTLESALRLIDDRAIVQIDFKRSARFEDVIDLVREVGAEDQTILIAYTMAAARKLHRLAPEMMISLSIADEDELARAIAAGVPGDRILAFTGTRSANPRLNAKLQNRNVEVIFGTLGGRDSIDNEIARAGDASRYAALAADGVDVIATDRPRAAHKALREAGRALEPGLCGVARTD